MSLKWEGISEILHFNTLSFCVAHDKSFPSFRFLFLCPHTRTDAHPLLYFFLSFSSPLFPFVPRTAAPPSHFLFFFFSPFSPVPARDSLSLFPSLPFSSSLRLCHAHTAGCKSAEKIQPEREVEEEEEEERGFSHVRSERLKSLAFLFISILPIDSILQKSGLFGLEIMGYLWV
jgi:hypothetical protein